MRNRAICLTIATLMIGSAIPTLSRAGDMTAERSAATLEREVAALDRDVAKAQEVQASTNGHLAAVEDAMSARNPHRAKTEIRAGLALVPRGVSILDSAKDHYREAKRAYVAAHEWKLGADAEALRDAAQALATIEDLNSRAEESNDKGEHLRAELSRNRQSFEDYDRDLRAEAEEEDEDDAPRYSRAHPDHDDLVAAWCAANICINVLPLILEITTHSHCR